MSDLKIQGEVQVTSEGAEAALDRVAGKAEQMAARVEKGAAGAGKAVDGIGGGAAKSAEQFSRAEGSITASIKRATSAIENLGKTASQKIELRISERGLDPAKFEPMLAKLRELEAAQKRLGVSSGQLGASSGAMGRGMQNVGYQLQDFVVQVNGGVDATRALSMQLPQMLVGFGAVGAGIGLVAALLPNIISAFGGMSEKSKSFSDAMGDVKDALGEVGSATRTFKMDDLAEEFNKATKAARDAIIEQVRFQQEYIRTTQLVAEKKFGESLGGLGAYGTGDKLLGAFASSSTEKLADQLGVTKAAAADLLPVIRGLNGGTEDVGLAFQKVGTVLLGGNTRAVELAKSLSDLAKTERDSAAASSALSKAQEEMAAGHMKTGKAVKAAKDELVELLNKINAKDVGLDASYWTDLQKLYAGYQSGRIGVDEYRSAVEKLTTQQKFHQDILKAEAAAEKEWADAARKAAGEQEKSLHALEDKAEKLEDELRYYGMSKSAIEDTTIARLEERQAMYAGIEGYDAEVAAIEREIDARKRAREAMKGIEARDEAKKAAEDAAKAWENFSRDIEQSLTDALMRSFEAGDNFGEAFVKSLQNTLKTAVLKVAVQAVVDPVMGGVRSALGMTSSGGTSSGLGALNTGSSLWSAYNGATSSAWSSFANGSIGTALGLNSGFSAAEIVSATAGGEAFSAAALGMGEAGALSGLASGIGTALPYIAAAIAVISLLSKEGGGPKTEGGLYTMLQPGANTFGEVTSSGQKFFTGNGADAMVQQILDPLGNGIEALIEKLGGTASGLEVALGFNSDPQGTAQDSVAGGVYKDGKQLYFNARGDYARGTYAQELQVEAQRVTLAALQAVDLNDLADTFLDSLDISKLSADAAAQATGFVASSQDIVGAFEKVGISAEDVTYDLIKAMGGFDAAGQSVNAMVQALEAIDQAAAGTSANFANSIRSIELSVLDNQGQYAYLDAEAARYRDVLASLIDPTAISDYAGRLNNTIMQAWGTLDRPQQQAKSNEFIALLHEADALALTRYDAAKENTKAQAQELAAAVKQAVAEAMAANVAASEAVATAVNNGIDARVSVGVTVTGNLPAEVYVGDSG